MHVRDAMVRNVMAADRAMALGEAARLMLCQGLEALPVIDAARRLEGLVAERDCFEELVLRPDPERGVASPSTMVDGGFPALRRGPPRVADAMWAPALTIHPDQRLSRVIGLMLETRANALPVVAGLRFVGMLSRRTLIALAAPAADELDADPTHARPASQLRELHWRPGAAANRNNGEGR